MILDWTHFHNFHWEMVNGLKISLFLELIVVLLRIKKYFLFIGEGPSQGWHNTKITAKAKYTINVTKLKNKICLSLNYNGSNCFLCANRIRINPSKEKYPVLSCIFCLCSISEDFSVDSMKKLNWIDRCMIFQLVIILLILVVL